MSQDFTVYCLTCRKFDMDCLYCTSRTRKECDWLARDNSVVVKLGLPAMTCIAVATKSQREQFHADYLFREMISD